MKYKVVVTDLGYSTYEPEREILEKVGASLVLMNSSDEADILAGARDADALISRKASVTRNIIQNLERCRIISRYGVGYDNIDIVAAAEKGIPVCNVPDYCMEEVSDQALALLLSCARKVTANDKKIRGGEWNITRSNPVHQIRKRTMGIIGLGRIGLTFLRKIKPLVSHEILVCDPYLDQEKTEKEYGVKMLDLEALLRESDYISLHVPLTDQTLNLINEESISQMKSSAILINTSRGPVVEERALLKALKEGKINSAGIDVFENEPLPADSPLFGLDNIVLSDHAAWYSEESELELKTKLATNVVRALKGEKIMHIVNQG